MELGNAVQLIVTIFTFFAVWAHIQVKAAVPEYLRKTSSLLLGATSFTLLVIVAYRIFEIGSVQWLYNLHVIFLGLYSVAMTVRLHKLQKRDYGK